MKSNVEQESVIVSVMIPEPFDIYNNDDEIPF